MNFALHLTAMIAIGLPNLLGYNLIFGKGKIFHFGPIGVSIAATYGCFVTLSWTESWMLALLIGMIFSLSCSALFAWLSFRLDPDGLGILSIAVHLTLLSVVLNWTDVTRGALGIPRIPRMEFLQTPQQFALVSVLIAAACIIGSLLLDRSSFGRKLSALAEHEWSAESLGISRVRTHLCAFLIGGLGALITSVLYSQYIHLVHPNDLTFIWLIFYVLVIVAGKPGSVLGVTLSATLLTLLREGLRFVPLPTGILGPLRLLLFGLILLTAVWWRRDSLFPKKRTI